MKMYLIPDFVFDSIYEITPAFFQEHGLRGMLVDLDGTMASSRAPLPPETVRPWLDSLQAAGVRVLVLSNNKESRVKRFCEPLGVPFLHRAVKPLSRGFRRGARALDLPIRQIAVVGDQIYTDTFGGNCVGATTCFVRSINRNDLWISMRHQLEKPFISMGKRKRRRGRP